MRSLITVPVSHLDEPSEFLKYLQNEKSLLKKAKWYQLIHSPHSAQNFLGRDKNAFLKSCTEIQANTAAALRNLIGHWPDKLSSVLTSRHKLP